MYGGRLSTAAPYGLLTCASGHVLWGGVWAELHRVDPGVRLLGRCYFAHLRFLVEGVAAVDDGDAGFG
jgi:hypothetical protein